MLTYLLINVFSLIIPLIFSFHPKLKFYKEWKQAIPAILIMAAFFLVWDHYFTGWGIWSFNPDYVMGFYIGGMPVEEWMFFLFIPYSCLFIYHCLNLFFKPGLWNRMAKIISWSVIAVCIFLMYFYWDRMYTFTTACFLCLFILLLMIYKGDFFLGPFYRAYLVSKIPFLAVNGMLTSLPVVIYNNNENTGIRLFTIPAEDTLYSMLMLMMTTGIYEGLKKRKIGR